jgi:hypothetical protein
VAVDDMDAVLTEALLQSPFKGAKKTLPPGERLGTPPSRPVV